jgi:Caspase domain
MATKALVVGIAKYANPKNNLDGLENDVSALIKLLGKFGVTDLEVIRDSNATADNIRNGLRNLVTGAKAGDTRIFYYSGHGALLPPDFSGTDDPDGRDEALVPYEGDVSSLILDNWVASFLKNTLPKNVFLWSIYDACHSGDMFKDAVVTGLPLPFPNDAREKIVPFEDLVFDAPPVRISPKIGMPTSKALILDSGLPNSVHFGAAEAEKTALVQQIEGVRRSVFTWALEQTAQPNISVADFEVAITAKQATITSHHTPQVACSNANKARKLFT